MLIPKGIKWDLTADVVIVGFGGAGGIAAMAAQEEGADVLVLEKQPEQSHHTNTSMAGGSFLCPSDVKGGVQYMEEVCKVTEGLYWTDRDTIRAWIEYAADNIAWIEARGGSFLPPTPAEYPELPGFEVMGRHRFRGMGFGFARYLAAQMKERKIGVAYETAARRFLADASGQVVGVEAERLVEGKPERIKVRAGRGVILAPGGFEFNETMKLNYLRVYPTYFTGSEANTGDGVRMALEVGADLWHMNCASGHSVMKFPDFPIAFYALLVPGEELSTRPDEVRKEAGRKCGYIITDRYGKRIVNEDRFRTNPPRHAYYYELASYDSQRLVYPRVPSYWLFDRNRIEEGRLDKHRSGPSGPHKLYVWSADNSVEIEKGWIVTAPTVRELARKLGLSPDTLEGTVTTYNRFCEAGRDTDFGRNPVDLTPLDRPPYCAVTLWPGGANTQGGPKRNTKGEVLNLDGEPIPGLYSAGELGNIFGMLYSGAGNLADCAVSGRMAGASAARRKG
ncbi:MAG: FAD-binding protein [Chloroflexi bacterium]|nr:FAD-binding protein [Chloroflexota bacterium]